MGSLGDQRGASEFAGRLPHPNINVSSDLDEELGLLKNTFLSSTAASDETASVVNAEAAQEDSVPDTGPWYVNLVLAAAICAVSSAGAMMRVIDRAAPLTRGGWRLQVTCVVLFPLFVTQWLRCGSETRRDFLNPRVLLLLLGSGAALAVHFALWIYSIDATSLPHSLLFVCTPPLILACWALLMGEKLSRGEVGGLALGVVGTVIISAAHALGAHSEQEVTAIGDLSAFAAACMFCVYISVGCHLREWMPLFVYSLPVTVTATCLLMLAGLAVEGFEESPWGKVSGPFGWLSPAFFLPVLYLGVGPGVVGHAGLNYVVRYMKPLVVAMAITIEPLLGSLIGWLLGTSGMPGLWTWVGGFFLIAATVWVNYAADAKKGRQRVKATELVAPEFDDGDDEKSGVANEERINASAKESLLPHEVDGEHKDVSKYRHSVNDTSV